MGRRVRIDADQLQEDQNNKTTTSDVYNCEPPLIDSTKNERCRGAAMLKSPFKSQPLGPSEPS